MIAMTRAHRRDSRRQVTPGVSGSCPLAKRAFVGAVALALVLAVAPVLAAAQTPTATTGVVVGTLKDSTGAVLPGVTVVLTELATNAARETISDSTGHYAFAAVLPGRYRITATLEGFRPVVVPEVAVEVNKTYTVDLTLAVGEVSEAVEVTAAAPLQKIDATIGSTLTGETVLRLPQPNRELTSIQFNQPLAVPYIGADSNRARAGSVAGSRTDQNTYILDGADVSDNLVGDNFLEALPSAVVPLPSESVEEFSVATTNANATFGRGSGAQFVIVTRRGTNRFRGSGYYYLQDDALNANTWDRNRAGVAKPPLEDKRGGFSLGGPVFRNRTFFFTNSEARRFPRATQVSRLVPTESLRAGILRFRDVSGRIVGYDLKALDPRGIGLNPVVAALWARLPAGNDPSRGDGLNITGFTADADTSFNSDVAVLRLDHNLNSNWRLDANYRYGSIREIGAAQADIGGILPGHQLGRPAGTEDLPREPRFVAAGLIGQITPRFLNELRVSYLRGFLAFTRVSPFGQVQGAGIGLDIGELDEPLDVTQAASRSQASHAHTYQIINNSTWVAGAHTVLFGATIRREDWRFQRNEQLGGSLTSPVAQITQGPNISIPAALRPPTCGAGIATNCLLAADVARFNRLYAAMLGLVDTVSVLGVRDGSLRPLPLGTPQDIHTTTNAYEFYVNDTWRLRSSLTLTAGLSYQWQSSPDEKDRRWAYLIDNRTGEILTSDIYLSRARAAAEAGQPFNPQLAFLPLAESGREDYFDTDWSNLGPRVALAWSPSFERGWLGRLFGVDRSVLRGGYALAFDRTNSVRSILSMGMAFGENLNVFAPRCTAQGTPGPGCNPAGSDPAAVFRVGVDGPIPLPSHPAVTSPIVPSGLTITTFADPRVKTGRTHSFDFSVQRALPGNITLEAGWVLRLGRELPQAWVLSSVPFFHLDRGSGQTFAQAFDQIAQQLRSGVNPARVTPQPWFENQLAPGQTAALAQTQSGSFIEGNLSALWLQINNRRRALGLEPLSNQQIQTLWARGDGGRSSYHALFVMVRKRASAGLSLTGSYTLSRALDQAGVRQNSVTAQSSGFDPDIDWGPASFDRTHVLTVTGAYDLPFGRGGGALSRLTGGWYVAGIVNASSGVPLDVCQRSGVFGGGLVFSGCVGAVPIRGLDLETGVYATSGSGGVGVTADPSAGGTGLNMFRDPEAVRNSFRPVLISEDRRAGRGTLRGLPRWNLDLSIGKKTRLARDVDFVFAAEILNVFNTVQFNNGALNFFAPANFGVIVSQGNTPRAVQLGFRLEF